MTTVVKIKSHSSFLKKAHPEQKEHWYIVKSNKLEEGSQGANYLNKDGKWYGATSPNDWGGYFVSKEEAEKHLKKHFPKLYATYLEGKK